MDQTITNFPKSPVREIPKDNSKDNQFEDSTQPSNVVGFFSAEESAEPAEKDRTTEQIQEARKEYADTVFSTITEHLMELLECVYDKETSRRLYFETTLLLTAIKSSLYRREDIDHEFQKVLDTIEGMINYSFEDYLKDIDSNNTSDE